MKARRALGAMLAGTLLMAAGFARAQPQVEGGVELYDYVVQAGDSCKNISLRKFGSARRYDIIHRHNPDMGPQPHVLTPGTILRLPRAATPTGPDAEVALVVRRVESRAPEAAAWLAAQRGLALFRGWRVNTQERSAAELAFRDETLLQLRENTLVIVFGGSSSEATRRTGDARLDSGALRARLGELRLAVETPAAHGVLAGGSAVLSVDAAGTSRISNHEGGAAEWASSAGGAAVRVAPGKGSKVLSGARPTRPRALPPPPVWIEAPTSVVVGLAGAGATLSGRWATAPGARATRVEVATSADGRGVIAAVEVPADVDRFELHGLADGTVHVRLATIDGDFFESRPSAPRSSRIVTAMPLGVDGRPAPMAVPDPTERTAALQLPAGAVLLAPEGIRCGTSAGAHGPRTALAHSGAVVVTCTGPSGDPVNGPAVEVVGPSVRVAIRGLVRRRARVHVTLTLEGGPPLPDAMVVKASHGVRIIAQRSAGGTISAELAIAPAAPDVVSLTVFPARPGSGVPLAETTLAVLPDPTREEGGESIDTNTSPHEPLRLPEALALAASPHFLALRAEPAGVGGWLAVSAASAAADGPAVLRAIAGVQAALPSRVVDLGLATALDVTGGGPATGSGDLRVALGFARGRGPFAIRAEAAAWLPTGGAGSLADPRLEPSVEATWAPGSLLVLRTRQGALFDLGTDGVLAWASAGGVDLRLAPTFTLGAELDAVIHGGQGVGAGVGLSLGALYTLGPLDLSAALRATPSPALSDPAGAFAAVFALRVRWEQQRP